MDTKLEACWPHDLPHNRGATETIQVSLWKVAYYYQTVPHAPLERQVRSLTC